MGMTKSEREFALTRMKAATGQFYLAAVNAGNPSFVQFAELMNEYIGTCYLAHDLGIDFSDTQQMHAFSRGNNQEKLFDLGQKFLSIFVGVSTFNPIPLIEADHLTDEGVE